MIEGSVERMIATWKRPGEVIEQAMAHAAAERSVMIAASCSYMLNPTLKMLRAEGALFSNPWRTRRGDWNPLGGGRGVTTLARLAAFMRATTGTAWWSWRDMHWWSGLVKASGIFKRGAKKTIEAKATAAKEIDEAPLTSLELANIIDPSVERFVRELRDLPPDAAIRGCAEWITAHARKNLGPSFSYALELLMRHGMDVLEMTPRIHVGTIHSFKGGEADVVYLFPDLSFAASKDWHGAMSDGRDSVVRTFYVGMTRAREQLIMCAGASPVHSVRIE